MLVAKKMSIEKLFNSIQITKKDILLNKFFTCMSATFNKCTQPYIFKRLFCVRWLRVLKWTTMACNRHIRPMSFFIRYCVYKKIEAYFKGDWPGLGVFSSYSKITFLTLALLLSISYASLFVYTSIIFLSLNCQHNI